jgi:DNA-binding CsgD family transcriptional regulator
LQIGRGWACSSARPLRSWGSTLATHGFYRLIVNDHLLFRGVGALARRSNGGSRGRSLDEPTTGWRRRRYRPHPARPIDARRTASRSALYRPAPGGAGRDHLASRCCHDRECLECGASIIPKSQPVERIREAIRRIIGGEVWLPPDIDLSNVPPGESAELVSRLSTLTPQQVRVLMMLGEGLLNKQIAFKLGVSEATIKAHVSAILQKLGVDSRTQAVIAINRIGAAGDWPRPNDGRSVASGGAQADARQALVPEGRITLS